MNIPLVTSMRKKPWNRVNLPVYSVSSKGGKPNMHICTYVSAVSMSPKRMMVAIYHGTQTLENVEANPQFVLQLLSSKQYNLVNQLGKQSGKKIDKISRLQKRKLLCEWKEFYILRDALAVMKLNIINSMNAGDHQILLCDVEAFKNLNEGEVLTTQILNTKGIIRI
jgi:flavin reductase (DIM6/NTAB) family NADH-FMN oxidoreductase RutF